MFEISMIKIFPDDSGFTILEILVASVMGIIFMTAVGFLIVDQTETHEDHQMKVVMQQNGRAAMSVISNEMMIAGYSAQPGQRAGILSASINGVTFDCFHDDGTNERVGYSYVGGEDRIGVSRDGGNRQTLLRDVEEFKILYAYDKDDLSAEGYGKLEPETSATHWAYDSDANGTLDRYYTLDANGKIGSNDSDGTSLTAQPNIERIRAAKIWLLMRSGKRKNKSTQEIQPDFIPDVDVLNLDTVNFSYRLYTTTVKFRNMYY